MKVSLNTIKQYIDFELPSVDKLVERINMQLGGVEEVIDLGDKYKDAVIVRVIECEKHPNADKLSICLIDDGGVVQGLERINDRQIARAETVSTFERVAEGGVQDGTATEQRSENDENVRQASSVDSSAVEQAGRTSGLVGVVCGAPNVHAGMWAVWLPPGATVPVSYGDKEPFVLDVRDIRGVKSHGMLAAGDELAINSNHDGIVELTERDLPEGKTLTAGAHFAEMFGLDDVIIDIENKMFTHRPDLFGQLGVAREIAGIYGKPFEDPHWYWHAAEFTEASGLELRVFNEISEKVPRLMAVAMSGVHVEPSPLWLQTTLLRWGSKAINNVVDATNYVMLLTAQPTHAYDYDKLRGHALGARLARDGEELPLLNSKRYTLSSEDVVIVDGEGAIGLAGIMGGGNSEVSAETKNIVLEVANFDMYTLRKSSMRHGLFTDALARFNKGQSYLQNDRVMSLLMQTLSGQAGATQASNVYDLHEPSDAYDNQSLNWTMKISPTFVNERLGLQLKQDEFETTLRNVHFTCHVGNGDTETTVIAPFWRTDIVDKEDVVEEVGRLHGFDKLPRELPRRRIAPVGRNPVFELKKHIRSILSQSGANEVLTYSFVHENLLKKVGQNPAHAFRLSNALSPDLQYYRLSIMPSLLDKVNTNFRAGYGAFSLFEIGKVHYKGKMDVDEPSVPNEDNHLACVVTYGPHEKPQGAAYYFARRYLEQLLALDSVEVKSMTEFDLISDEWGAQLVAAYEPKRTALIVKDSQVWGVVGEFSTAVKQTFKLPEFTAGFEIHLDLLKEKQVTYTPLSRFPSTTQDISLKVASDVAYADVYNLAKKAITSSQPGDCHTVLSPLSIYQAEDDVAHKTITLRLTISSYEKTLTDAEVNSVMDTVARDAVSKFSAERI